MELIFSCLQISPRHSLPCFFYEFPGIYRFNNLNNRSRLPTCLWMLGYYRSPKFTIDLGILTFLGLLVISIVFLLLNHRIVIQLHLRTGTGPAPGSLKNSSGIKKKQGRHCYWWVTASCKCPYCSFISQKNTVKVANSSNQTLVFSIMALENPPFSIGKSTINGPFSIANC